jgi:glycosyltransferase involved in cell wall biosynthesis
MKILIDALFLRSRKNGGGETYIRSLLSSLSMLDRENSYLVLSTERSQYAFQSLGANFEIRPVHFNTERIGWRLLYEQFILPILAYRWGADLAFFPANMMSLGVAALSIPSVVTIHDASFDYYQKVEKGYESSLSLFVKAWLAKTAARLATRVVSVSKYGRSEICRTTGICESKVAVVPLAASEISAATQELGHTLEMRGIVLPYVLIVGRVQKHKNLDRFVRAFATAKRQTQFPHHLVIAGMPHSGQADLESTIQSCGVEEFLHLTGFVEEEELRALYEGADVLAMPSLYEGFGLPVLEAMNAGVPVIASKACSLPEVAGCAALYFDPRDESSISKALVEIITDRNRHAEFVEKGRVHAKTFTWPRAASQMVEIFHALVAEELANP